jgi:hypothetical protein
MRLRERWMRWWRPAEWREDHPSEAGDGLYGRTVDGAPGLVEPQHGVGAESWDRVDVDRDFRKP